MKTNYSLRPCDSLNVIIPELSRILDSNVVMMPYWWHNKRLKNRQGRKKTCQFVTSSRKDKILDMEKITEPNVNIARF